MSPTRRELLHLVASELDGRRSNRVLRVAVDGVDGAGKTVFADELAEVLRRRGVPVIRTSVDAFHHPPELRYRRGRTSPEGFFLDSYDYDAFQRLLLDPLGPGGGRRYTSGIYDVDTERPLEHTTEVADDGSILLVDGIFLHRPELRDAWDLSVFLEVDFEVSIPRGAARGMGDPDPHSPANRRYVEGQRHYLRTCQPHRHASLVIDNHDLERPRIVSRRG